MERENEDKSVRGYASRKRHYKRTRNLLILILLVVVVIIGIIVTWSIYNRNYHNYKVVKSIQVKGETTVGYLNYGSYIVKYGKNGAIAYNRDGKVQWNSSYNMSDPVANVCDKYIVIADRGNKQVRVFNAKGSVGQYSTEYSIIKVEVGNQGVVGALMEEGDNNYIKLYSIEGRELAKIKTSVKDKDTGYPVDFSLSDDAKKIVVSFLAISGNDVFSRVGFFNFGEVGKNYTNRMVGGFNSNKGTIASRVEFIGNNTVGIYKNNGFEIYAMKEIPKLVKKVETKSKIKSIFHNKEYTGIVTEPDSKSDMKLLLYNLSGKQVLNKQIKLDYKKLYMIHDEVIFYDSRTCNIIRRNGKNKFKHTFDGDISGVYPIDMNHYYLLSETKISIVRLD